MVTECVRTFGREMVFLKAIIWQTDNEARGDNKISLSEVILEVEKKVKMKNNARN